MRKLAPRLAFLLVGAVVGVALLVMLLRSVHLDQLGSAFSHVRTGYLLASLPFLVINFGIKVPRWALLYGAEAPQWDVLFGAMNVGYAINALLPLRMGEIVRTYWVRDQAGVSMMRSLSTVALERVSDGVTLLVMLVITAPTVAFPRRLLGSALLVGAAFIVVLLVMIALAFSATSDEHPLTRFLLHLEHGATAPVARILRQTVIGLQALRDWGAVVRLVAFSAVSWGANGFFIWFMLRAFGLSVPLTAGFLLTAVLNLGMAVPSTPGYVGVFEYLTTLTLGLYGANHTRAVAAALGLHAVSFVPVTLIGLAYILRTGVQTTAGMVRGAPALDEAEPARRPIGTEG